MTRTMKLLHVLLLCLWAAVLPSSCLAVDRRQAAVEDSAASILFGSSIAAVNLGASVVVYTQTVTGDIVESTFDGPSWTGGAAPPVVRAKIGSPIAAVQGGRTGPIRVYYLSEDNMLRETVRENGFWIEGSLNFANIAVAPYSRIAAVPVAGSTAQGIRLYAQHPNNTISEYAYNAEVALWSWVSNVGLGVAGSGIAGVSYNYDDGITTRVFYQHRNLFLTAKENTGGRWGDSAFYVAATAVPPRAALAATNYAPEPSDPSDEEEEEQEDYIHVFYTAQNNVVREMVYDGVSRWAASSLAEPSIPGTELSAVDWGTAGDDLNLRLYLQNGTLVSGVSEKAYTDGAWVEGTTVISPGRTSA